MRTTLNVLYWILSVLITALVIKLVDDTSFSNSFFVGTMFLPGALAARYMLPKVSFKRKGEGIRNTVYIVLAIILMEFFLLIISHNILHIGYRTHSPEYFEIGFKYPMTGVMNLWFITLMVSVLAVGGYLLDRWVGRNHPEMESGITFCSDRKKVTLLPNEIVYVESCDTEVYIHASDGRTLRNKTGISQWESVLDERFIRVHRAFLVNSKYVSSYKGDTIKVGDEELPVSRKYQKDLKELFPAS
ncbi:MAG: LytTR family transcriptional regulator [Bacteroidaceae bacterium]|nr:LytTR family transcriptional regulator [Bacteroidaceae bacterium]